MKSLIIILIITLTVINTEEEDPYYTCLNNIVEPISKTVISNIRNHRISENLDLIYEACREQFICEYSKMMSSIEYVKDYIYKDIYLKIFEIEPDLTLLHNYYWNHKSPSGTEKECYSILGNDFECKELVDSFYDWINRKFTN